LTKEVEKGTFRRDLFFRLNVMKIRLTPLRERKEDIPALIEHILARAGGNRSLTGEVMEALLSYNWPGNVRELENCIQHMVAISSDTLVHIEDLPSPLQNHVAQRKFHYLTAAVGGPAPAVSPSSAPPLHPETQSLQAVIPLAELERRAILQALESTRGDRAMAASLLGIGRTTLYRKLKEYNVGE